MYRGVTPNESPFFLYVEYLVVDSLRARHTHTRT